MKKLSEKTENVIASKPLVYEGKIYFGSEDGYVYCVRAIDTP